MTQLCAFVARSFAPKDETRIQPVLEFLDTFRKIGFFWESAEAAEVERVSEKVCRMIDEKDVFIGFFTKRLPTCTCATGIRAALRVLRGDIRHEKWSAPPWVLQESGYALRAKKKLILLVEPGVEQFGLQSDLEYIPFDPENPAEIQSKLSDMIHGLLQEAAGTEVSVTVTERQEKKEAVIEATPDESRREAMPHEPEEPDILTLYLQMREAAERRDLDGIACAYEAGEALVTAKKARGIDSLVWDCIRSEYRFRANAPDGLEALRRLRAESPNRVEPILAIARCLQSTGEFEEAAGLFLEGAALQEAGPKADSLVNAAKAFREIRQYEQGQAAITEALPISTGDLRAEAVKMQCQLLKDLNKEYFAFAVAECALHENPLLPLRFALGLDYHRKSLNDLGLSHFRFLHERDKEDSSSLHNLALMYSECGLPIASVEHYKLAFSAGETLSAANLGFRYLEAGMAEEAKELVRQAMSVENYEARVEQCLAEITQCTKREKEQETSLLQTATTKKTFLVEMGRALMTTAPPVEGRWKFPFGEMLIKEGSGRICGTAEIRSETTGFVALLGSHGSKVVKIERYTLEGRMTGSVCEFGLSVANVDANEQALGTLGISSLRASKSGFIVFARDGNSAAYVELVEDKLGTPGGIVKVAGVARLATQATSQFVQ